MDDPLSITLHIAFAAVGSPMIGTVGIIVGCLFLLLLLAISAFVSGSEVALFSLSDAEIVDIAAKDTKQSRRVIKLLSSKRKLLITILVLNTLVNVSAVTLATFLTIQLAAIYGWSETAVVLVEMIVLTFLLLVVSEISPKITASKLAASYSLAASGLLSFGQKIFGFLTTPLASLFDRIDSRSTREASILSSEDVKVMADLSEASGTLEESERDLIHSVIDLGEKSVVEVMTSRVDITGIPHKSTLDDAIKIITESGKSRLPLYSENLDNVEGIIYAKDLLPYIQSNGSKKKKPELTTLSRTPLFVPESKKLDDLLNAFQDQRTHIAVVVDEYGGTEGLVTMEDILEEIIGDIRQESGEIEDPEWERLGEGIYRFDAGIDLDDVVEVVNADLSDDKKIEINTESFDFESLGGLVFHLNEDIPQEGLEIEYQGLRMRVETVVNHRITSVALVVDV